jgi:hypothetical protein
MAPEKRGAFLQEACQGDDALRGEVERLMANDSEAQAFMATRALDVAARALDKDQPGSADLTGKIVLHYHLTEKIVAGGCGREGNRAAGYTQTGPIFRPAPVSQWAEHHIPDQRARGASGLGVGFAHGRELAVDNGGKSGLADLDS